MARLSGGAGSLYVEYQLAVELGAWSIVYDDHAGLNERRGSGTARIVSADPFWSRVPSTRIRLRLGPTLWEWKPESVRVGAKDVSFTVHGDPEIR